jgi:hypothetical protein
VVTAYILIQTEVGKAAQVAKDIVEIKGVQQAEDVTGPYDVIARAEARNLDELGKLVVARGAGGRRHHQDAHLSGGTPLALRVWSARPPSGVRPTAFATATAVNRCGWRRAAALEAARSQTPTNDPELPKQSLKIGVTGPRAPETALAVPPLPLTEKVTASRPGRPAN